MQLHGAQPSGCNPIVTAVKAGLAEPRPVRKPETIANRWPIGDPADGIFAVDLIRESGGWAEDVSRCRDRDAMVLLARTEGIFAETAGGVIVAVARKLIEQGRIARGEEVVLCLPATARGRMDACRGPLAARPVIKPSLEEFDQLR